MANATEIPVLLAWNILGDDHFVVDQETEILLNSPPRKTNNHHSFIIFP